MKYINQWCMSFRVYADNGNKWASNQIFEANSFEEACEKARRFAETQPAKNLVYKSMNKGYQMSVGGGCRW